MALFCAIWEEIQFLSWHFVFLAMSRFTRVSFRLFVAWNIHTVIFLPISVSSLLFFMLFLVAVISLSLLFFK